MDDNPTVPTDHIQIDDTAIVSSSAIIRGSVTIGPGCVIHPNASIIAEFPIILGSDNIVEEQAFIYSEYKGQPRGNAAMRIGNLNLFETDCYVKNVCIGDMNAFESKSRCEECSIKNMNLISCGAHIRNLDIECQTVVFSRGQMLKKIHPLCISNRLETHKLYLYALREIIF